MIIFKSKHNSYLINETFWLCQGWKIVKAQITANTLPCSATTHEYVKSFELFLESSVTAPSFSLTLSLPLFQTNVLPLYNI